MEHSKLEPTTTLAASGEPSQLIPNSILGRSRPVRRRDFLALASAGAAAVSPLGAGAAEPSPFPKGFLWGAATAAHQVEGNNINSDLWVLEHLKPTIFAEPSGDACDHYHRYADDIKMLAGLGFNTYRFSIEWARIEPEQGFFSNAELDHYRRMLAACHENGVQPMVTFSHFSLPRWFAGQGGWESDGSVELFARYTEHAAKQLGDLISYATTFNEPNVPTLLLWMNVDLQAGSLIERAARAIGSDRFGSFFLGDREKLRDHMVAAHRRALAAMKSGPGKYPVGVNIAMMDDQAVGSDSSRDRKRQEVYGPWLDAASASDFVGVQTYTRARVGKDKDLPPEPGVELTQVGWEFWPEALGETIRYAAAQARVPVYVTENGIATEDDPRRIEYIRRALAGVRKCLADRIDVRGYIHWSLMDNFEWMSGFRPKFGLMGVNRDTQERVPRPSARFLGDIARRNGA
jgi:beta-glucosidase